MSITITRRQAQQFRAVLRRALGTVRGPGPAVGFIADREGLSVRCSSADAAIELRIPGERTEEALWMPFQFLADCEAKKDEPVELAAADKGRVTAQWRDGNVPQTVSYDAEPPADAGKFPDVPETFIENPPRLLRALADAGETCDLDATRYALACLQLRGPQGSIGATDGRQMLVQSGFTFPWEDDLLIPRSKVFSSPELAGDQPVLVGKSGDWVALRVGAWTVWLAVNKDGRFPNLSPHIPRANAATARCSISPADVEFLAQAIPRLPSNDPDNHPVTLDLNGHVAIRARAADQEKPTEVVLNGSSWSGEPIRLNMNRKFLARAAKFGFQNLCVYGNESPVLCQDENRQYVWALLEPSSVIPPAEDAIRIESPKADPVTSVPQPRTRRKIIPMSEPVTHSNGHAQSNGQTPTNGKAKTNGQVRRTAPRKAGQQDLAGLIQQAEVLRTALRDTLVKTHELLKGLKQHRRHSRVVQQTIAQLRTLKTLGV